MLRVAMPIPEYVMFCRVPADRTAAQMAGFKSMLAGIAQMAGVPETSVRDVARDAGTMTVFAVDGVPVQLAAGAVRAGERKRSRGRQGPDAGARKWGIS